MKTLLKKTTLMITLISMFGFNFKAGDEIELEQFINTHTTVMVRKDALDAAIFLKSKYNHILPIYHQSEHPVFSYDEYERYCNRYVTQYELYGLTKGDTPILEVFTVDWFNKDAIKYAEDNMGQFIKISIINDIGE